MKLEDIEKRLEELRPAFMEYNLLNNQRNDLITKLRADKKDKERFAILNITEFESAEFPDIGYPGCPGWAVFESEEQAKELCQTVSGYTYSYWFKWSGPGYYTTRFSHRYDHDGELCHTATFINSLNEIDEPSI